MTNPIDTIREALNGLHVGHHDGRLPEEPPCPYCERRAAALAALTEVEQQLAEAGSLEIRDGLRRRAEKAEDRAVAAETALAVARERLIVEAADHEEWAKAEEQRDAYRVQSEAQASEALKWRKRAVAAETALAEAEAGRDALVDEIQREYVLRSTHLAIVGAAEQRANELADALRDIRARVRTRSTGIHMDGTTQYAQPLLGEIDSIARAALDRHTSKEGT